MLKAVTFDFWNTLYGEPEGRAVLDLRVQRVGEVLAREGLARDKEQVVGLFQGAWQEAWREQRFHGQDIGPRGQVAYIARELGITSDMVIEDIYDAYTGVLLISPPALKEGVRETLQDLGGKVKLAVICNTGASPGSILRRLLKQDAILDHFDYLTFSDEVKVAKPNPQIFNITLDHLAVEPGQAIHVGDDGVTDIIGAKRTGMYAAWVNPATWPLPECDWHIRSLTELVSIVNQLQN